MLLPSRCFSLVATEVPRPKAANILLYASHRPALGSRRVDNLLLKYVLLLIVATGMSAWGSLGPLLVDPAKHDITEVS